MNLINRHLISRLIAFMIDMRIIYKNGFLLSGISVLFDRLWQ